jgi:hypothetical protein
MNSCAVHDKNPQAPHPEALSFYVLFLTNNNVRKMLAIWEKVRTFATFCAFSIWVA